MAWVKINKYGGIDLPSHYICKSTDTKVTVDVVDGSTLWVWDSKLEYVFAEGDWRPKV